jgi:hypothetical protein
MRGDDARGCAMQMSDHARPKAMSLHGGLNPGAPRGARNGNFTDGTWSTEAIEERRWLRSLVRSFGKPENAP